MNRVGGGKEQTGGAAGADWAMISIFSFSDFMTLICSAYDAYNPDTKRRNVI